MSDLTVELLNKIREEAKALGDFVEMSRKVVANLKEEVKSLQGEKEDLERKLEEMSANAENLYERLRFADTYIKGDLGGLRNPARTSALAAHKKLMETK